MPVFKSNISKPIAILLIISFIIPVVTIIAQFPPPLYIELGYGKYERIDVNGATEWIGAGDTNLWRGRYFRIDATTYSSRKLAMNYEVNPAGFPISCCFMDSKGIYAFHPIEFIIDFFIWMAVAFFLITVLKIDIRKLGVKM